MGSIGPKDNRDTLGSEGRNGFDQRKPSKSSRFSNSGAAKFCEASFRWRGAFWCGQGQGDW